MKFFQGLLLLWVLLISLFSYWTVPTFSSITYAQDQQNQQQWSDNGTRWVAWDPDCDPQKDIMLNTNVPFVWRCIKRSTEDSATQATLVNVFPRTMWALSRITMTAVIIIGFLWILTWWFLIASAWAFNQKALWIKIITSVIAWLILLGASAIILNLINPEFFGTDS